MAKVHIGLVSENKNFENLVKESSQQMGGAYIHHSKSIFELIQKLAMQKLQMLMIVLPTTGEGSDFAASYSFIRSKKDLQDLPICVLTETPVLETSFLLTDTTVRAFPMAGGLFLPILSMAPLIQQDSPVESILTTEWIKSEFLQSLAGNVGQSVQFQIRDATEDERRLSFFSQTSEEVRTHLGWFKFTARLLDTEGGISRLFAGMNQDTIEEVSQVLLNKVTTDFKQKVMSDLTTRGAVYLPELDKLSPAERKIIYSQTKYVGILFEADQCQVLLEIGKSI